MNPVFFIKEGDRLPNITGTVRDGDGEIVILTGCTVKFIMSRTPGGTPVINAAAALIALGVTGRVTYAWGAADTTTAGTFYGEFEITFPGGLLETFPNGGYITIIIGTDLA